MAVQLLLALASCVAVHAQIPNFGNGLVMGYIGTPIIDEASGLAASQLHEGILYTHNDHGDAPHIYAINASDASLVSTLTIGSGATNHDWEDVAVGPCSNGATTFCIYIADTGFSSANAEVANIIYRVQEPASLTDKYQTLTVDSTLKFNWTEEESQAVMVDPQANVYIVSNVLGGRGTFLKLPPAWGQAVPTNVASTTTLLIRTSHHDPTAADISPDGKRLLIKAKYHVYYWNVPDGDYLAAVTKHPYELPYIHESLGESICWNYKSDAYFTLGEGHYKPLYQYQSRS
ncbi:uncharacterized protein LOC110461632 isoform X2 [Mizuhopecten yessoensis]|uniref:Uncharacterized protein n=1 Tax=Mizuhopecten yessoensis TaxID=6573 RepID=A0A210PZZ5_MIZYE|nr:uncharacterized protein LOC110461632 isoform X2 [Mizuhopecten yessoensis]OWF42052.1 hypothetical protein KP79_PYT07632 [Mizuhopecten yessoensis]